MAYLTVTTAVDVVDPSDGKLSLREAVAQTNTGAGADTIRFLAALEGKTLVLTGGELVVRQGVTIEGDRNADGMGITIDGNQNGRVLNIAGGDTDITLRNLAITGGDSLGYGEPEHSGGAILLNGGGLIIDKCNIFDNHSTYQGGAVYAIGKSQVTVVDSIIRTNVADYSGGGIFTLSQISTKITNSDLSENRGYGGGAIAISDGGTLSVDATTFNKNKAAPGHGEFGEGGAIKLFKSSAVIQRSLFSENDYADRGGAIIAQESSLSLDRSTVSGNVAAYYGGGVEGEDHSSIFISNSTIANNRAPTGGGGVRSSDFSLLSISNSTLTGNRSTGRSGSPGYGGGIHASNSNNLVIFNTIVTGNTVGPKGVGPDISAAISQSNGHNIFGSAVAGSIPGDRQNVAPATIFAAVDPVTGGGQLSPTGIVPLKSAITNPALSAADPITASSFGQLGTTLRPLPAGSLPDIGAIEIKQPLSTSPTVNNDVLTGSNAANNLSGLAGNDLIQGLGGKDVLNGQDGSDVLDGGTGNDALNGGLGMDIATFAGTTAVVVDLSAKPATAKRGGETDTLTSIEGVIGSSKADVFKGDAANNEFQGGLGKDTATGGAGRDLYAFKTVQDSPAGSGRDVIKDFAPGQDVIDVSDIDADSTTPGQQSFRWVGKATLTGAAQLGYYVSGGNTIVRASTDADAKPELEMQLTGNKALTAADFRL
ncbi:MAG: M10 family metallopeptidase C-terminal domain-containing protein [Geminicoccaceae bacterium]